MATCEVPVECQTGIEPLREEVGGQRDEFIGECGDYRRGRARIWISRADQCQACAARLSAFTEM